MMVSRLLLDLSRRIRHEWDRPSQMAILMALVLFVLTLAVLFFGPDDLRDQATIGAVGLVLSMQVIVMWGNRHMVKPYTQAQRHFLAGELESARDVLEQSLNETEPDADTLTLLGNTYRQLGDLGASEHVLRQALDLRPAYHFPLYGLGRTLLINGDYAVAAELIEKALAAGAPLVVQFDIGHCWYRLGDVANAIKYMQAAKPLAQDPHRVLMIDYVLYRLDASPAPDPQVIRDGLPLWEAELTLYEDTPYVRALQADVQQMQSRLEEV